MWRVTGMYSQIMTRLMTADGRDLPTSIYLHHQSGAMHELGGRRLKKLQREILAGRGGVEVTQLVESGYDGFLARSGDVHDFEDLASEFRGAAPSPSALVETRVPPAPAKTSKTGSKLRLTPAMREALSEIARGVDPNMMADLARFMGKRQEKQCAKTLLGLLGHGLLQMRQGGGLEISALGREIGGPEIGGREIGGRG